MLNTMATMQDAHNKQVHPDWRNSGYEYYRAVWVECAEMLDHFGWKWWQRQQPDLEQVKLELVDIWHFGLSDLLRSGELNSAVVGVLDGASEPDIDGAGQAGPSAWGSSIARAESVRLAIEDLARATLAAKAFALPQFARVMAVLPLPYDELFRLYVGKNVLNRFRQDNGYKAGTYVKVWAGREDNEHLVELLDGLDNPDTVVTDLYRRLKARYPGSTSP